MEKQRIRMAAASVQVDFSRKSAVLRIPIDWPAEVKFAASPPPRREEEVFFHLGQGGKLALGVLSTLGRTSRGQG